MTRCAFIRANGVKCKKHSIVNGCFCNLHTSEIDLDHDIDLDIDIDEVVPEVCDNVCDNVCNNICDVKKDTRIDDLISQLQTLMMENTFLKKENEKKENEMKEIKKVKEVKSRTYTIKGLHQRAMLEHYHHKKTDVEVLQKVADFYNQGGIKQYNKYAIKTCIDSMFQNCTVEEKDYWYDIARKYFADKQVIMRM